MMRITRRRLGVLWSFVAVLLLATVIPILQAQEGEAFAPADQAAFEDLVVGQRMIFDDSISDYWEFMAGGRFKGVAGADSGTGSYSYSNTGVNTGDLALNVDDGGESFTAHLVFTSTTAGTVILGPDTFSWRLIPIPELTTLYFPDYADGAGWSVQLALSHIAAATKDAAVFVAAYDREGQVIPDFFETEYIFEGRLVSSLANDSFEIPPLGTRVLKSNESHGQPTPSEREFRRGWIVVKTDTASVSGLLTYRNAETGVEVSVEPVELGSYFALFVEESSDIGTGLAIFKPDLSSTIEFRIYGEDGINPLDEEFARVGDFNQAGRTIPEWFAMDGIDTEFLKDFRGILLLRAEDDSLFAPIGIRFGNRGESLSTVPVVGVTEVPETGLNTSLTDPNGQWMATAKAKIIEKNDTYWEFSYFVDMTNRTGEEQEYTVKIHFVDADGFSVEAGYAGNVFNKIPAKSTKRLLDRALIDTENASTVTGIRLEVSVR